MADAPTPAVDAAGAPVAAALPGAEEPKKLSKKEERILKRQAAQTSKGSGAAAGAADDASAGLYGERPMVQSTEYTGRKWTRVGDLTEGMNGSTVLVRARVHAVRPTGKAAFMLMRQSCHTVQAVVWQGEGVSKQMVKFAQGIPKESVIDIEAQVKVVEAPIESASKKNIELAVSSVWIVSKANPELPFQLDDAARKEDDERPGVGIDTRFDNRWIDLRIPAHHAIMRLSSAVCTLFREFLLARDFTEIQTPKLLAGASEGGAQVFVTDYFGRVSCLAQSPQLYKQMVAACADFERVFEIGPVFRAEDSNTPRHLCEFHGLDLEMTFNEHYYEVLEVFSDLFVYIFDNLNKRYRTEIEAVRAQYPFEDLKYLNPTLRLSYAEGIALLQEAGINADPEGDLKTDHEKALGRIVREKYGTDFFFLDKYPLAVRPFYTMPAAEDPKLSNSYDFFIRGQEILSGAQRVHDVDLLIERATAKGVPISGIQSYVDSFKHGAMPHGGGGVGLERVVMLFLGLPNIRYAAMFPRDPKRLEP